MPKTIKQQHVFKDLSNAGWRIQKLVRSGERRRVSGQTPVFISHFVNQHIDRISSECEWSDQTKDAAFGFSSVRHACLRQLGLSDWNGNVNWPLQIISLSSDVDPARYKARIGRWRIAQ